MRVRRILLYQVSFPLAIIGPSSNFLAIVLAYPDAFLERRRCPKATDPTVLGCLLAAIAFHLIYYGTRGECSYILGSLQMALTTYIVQSGSKQAPPSIPRDLRTALSSFDLDPVLTAYVCCPKCCKLYSPTADGTFPETCSWSDRDNKQCGAHLLRDSAKPGVKVPLRVYEHQTIHQWWAQVLNRPGIEDAMDDYVRNTKHSETAQDIWNAKRLRKMVFSDGCRATSDGGSTGHYVFSLAIDWFKVHGGKVGKKTWSVGAIYLTCQNLPPELRFQKENICLVGIIPGPRKPVDTQLSHFLDKVVDDLVILREGIYVTETFKHPSGRLVYAQLGPVIADLDACRAIGGCSGHSHKYFCSFCHLTRDDITNFRPTTWKPRTFEEHTRAARQWLDADSERLRLKVFDQTGVFWTPLMRLGYWDPTKDLILDVMHNQFLGLAREHCRIIWGMDVQVEGGDGTGVCLKHVPSRSEMMTAWGAIRSPINRNQKLNKLGKDVLWALCVECEITERLPPKPVKAAMIAQLMQWASLSTFLVINLLLTYALH